VLGVLEAFAVIGAVIGVGVVVGRMGVLGEHARVVLNRVAFHIGMPALLLVNLASATLRDVFSPLLLVSAVATLAVFAVSFAIAVLGRGRDRGDGVIASLTASYVNSGNLGIPLSAYAFGNVTDISAVAVFQVAIVTPLAIVLLNSATVPRQSIGRQAVALLVNPIIVASAIGLGLACAELEIPTPIFDTLRMLGDLAIPAVLIAFGISLSQEAMLRVSAERTDVAIAVMLKLVLMPLTAYGFGRWLIELDGHSLLVATVLAALPSAQNISTYATVYRRAEGLARDATLISTLLSIPIIVGVVLLLGSS